MAAALNAVDVRPLNSDLAKSAGLLLAVIRTFDVRDATLALLCEPDDTILTSDIDDLASLLVGRELRTVGLIRV